MPASPADKRHAAKLLKALAREFPDATCSLDFRTPLELLVATILSAQCTDERVNRVTKDLFAKYRSAADYADAATADLERDIQSTGFFRNKTKSIQGCCRRLVEQYGGQVPEHIEQLVELPGIGRKTANVILGTWFHKNEGVVVDTHVTRLSRRLGLSRQNVPERIEQNLMALYPRSDWTMLAHLLIWHGRRVCAARKPACDRCTLADLCPKVGVR